MEPNFRCFRIAARNVMGGWVQQAWRDDDGNVCLLQALIDAMGIGKVAATLPFPVLRAVDATLATTGTYCVGKKKQARRNAALAAGDAGALSELIWRWNDEPGRTKAEVVDVLQMTADRLENDMRPWLRDLIARAIRPSSRRYAEDEEFALAD